MKKLFLVRDLEENGLRKVGCYIHKLSDYSIKGRFLGYYRTMQNILRLDKDTNASKTAWSALFSKIFSNLLVSSPNILILKNISQQTKFNLEGGKVKPLNGIFISESPFTLSDKINQKHIAIMQYLAQMFLKIKEIYL